jgi:hypothetical protein
MDPHEDLVANNRAAIDAHRAEIARLASDNPDAGKPEVSPEDQAVLDAKKAVEEAQSNLIAAMQVAYIAKIERADAVRAKAAIDAEAEKESPIFTDDEGNPPLTPPPVQARPTISPA